jgi:PKD repeat protein
MIVGDPGGPFNVVGSHTYAQAGNYTARVTINELDAGNSASTSTTADVISFAIELLQPPSTGRVS